MYTREQAVKLQDALKDVFAMPEVKAKLEAIGLVMKPGTKGTFGDTLTVKMTFGLAGQAGVDMAKAEFERQCFLYGLKPTDYLREFVVNGEKFKLTGFNPAKPKNCYRITKVSTGKSHICDHGFLRAGGILPPQNIADRVFGLGC